MLRNMSLIAIMAPSPIRGSGGVARIYSFASALCKHGHQTDIYVFDSGARSGADLSRDAENFYAVDGVRIIAGTKLDKEYDLIIATRWDTAKLVRDMPAHKRAYLIQDFEACFNPVGDGTVLAENSYMYGLQSITYGRWLALKLHKEFGNSPYYLDFATDLTTFRIKQPMKDRLTQPPTVCFIYQHDKPRRCPNLGIEALGIVKHLRPDVQLYFVGSNESPKLWYDYKNAGLLSTEALNDLYNRCHVGLCLSSSNPSCNAFDMMSAGLPSVELYRENNLFDIPSGGVLLAHQTPESLAEAILFLISSPAKLLEMSNFGIEYMKSRSADKEIRQFLSAIDDILEGKDRKFDVAEALGQRFDGKAVVAPAYRNPYVFQHIQSQLNRFSDFNKQPDFTNCDLSPLEEYNFVTTVNSENAYRETNSATYRSRLKRVIKKVIGVA
jgi:glycosyltransferase involved in cell wall biosynthesis